MTATCMITSIAGTLLFAVLAGVVMLALLNRGDDPLSFPPDSCRGGEFRSPCEHHTCHAQGLYE